MAALFDKTNEHDDDDVNNDDNDGGGGVACVSGWKKADWL